MILPDLGLSSLVFALFFAVYSIGVGLFGATSHRKDLVASAWNAACAVFLFIAFASFALLHALMTHNFGLKYVIEYSSTTMPKQYLFAAFWGGMAGSMLLWALLLSFFAMLVGLQNRNQHQDLIPYVIATIMANVVFFVAVMLFGANPFEKAPVPAVEGTQLNPLLQNPSMMFHPPTLYTGYVGMVTPYAFAVAALITGRLDDAWIRITRRWTLFAWFFLGMGILMGAQWAYVELGWGGYWGWDPVENASLMPWLVATAFLHSVMVQEKKGMLKVWNVSLISLAYLLSIFGTFLTRSGVLSSVHAFANSSLGPYFLTFLGFQAIFASSLICLRWEKLRSSNEIESFISKESSFLLNNLLLLGAAIAVFWGTVYPAISEALRGVKVTVAAPYFNRVVVPLGLATLTLTGICPLIAWRRASPGNLKRSFSRPLIGAVGAAVVMYLFGIRRLLAVVPFSLCVFVIGTVVLEFYRGTIARKSMTGESLGSSFVNLIGRNRRRYGGYIVHLGIVSLIAGITGSSVYKVQKEAILRIGETMKLSAYTLRYDKLEEVQAPNRQRVIAHLSVRERKRFVGTLLPEKDFYPDQDQPATETAIRGTLKDDLYVILSNWDSESAASFTAYVNPLVSFVWLSGLFILAGTAIAVLPERERVPEAARSAAQPSVAETATS